LTFSIEDKNKFSNNSQLDVLDFLKVEEIKDIYITNRPTAYIAENCFVITDMEWRANSISSFYAKDLL
jgi:hypothetical protein